MKATPQQQRTDAKIRDAVMRIFGKNATIKHYDYTCYDINTNAVDLDEDAIFVLSRLGKFGVTSYNHGLLQVTLRPWTAVHELEILASLQHTIEGIFGDVAMAIVNNANDYTINLGTAIVTMQQLKALAFYYEINSIDSTKFGLTIHISRK